MGEHLLVAFDASDAAREALAHAVDDHDAETVTALYVVQSGNGSGPYTDLVRKSGLERDQLVEDDRLGDVVAETASELAAERGVDVDTRVESGDPVDTVAEVAAEDDVDHVLVGEPPNRNGFGPVAHRVIVDCTTTVTLVRES